MLAITSQGMPRDATTRLKTESTFDALKGVDSVRTTLAIEQGRRCAYCERRLVIKSDFHATKIEHFHPQRGPSPGAHCASQAGVGNLSDAPIAWSNLLLCCLGSLLGSEKSCDTSKANTDICDGLRNPKRQTQLDTLVEIADDGRATPRAPIDAVLGQQYLEGVLSLNHPLLVQTRLNLRNELQTQIRAKFGRPLRSMTTSERTKTAEWLRDAVQDQEYASVYLSLARHYDP